MQKILKTTLKALNFAQNKNCHLLKSKISFLPKIQNFVITKKLQISFQRATSKGQKRAQNTVFRSQNSILKNVF